MSPRTLWSSDHHFHHRAILDERMAVRRPFASIEEHDETLIANWNAAVRPEDTVWHLGDFCYRCPEERAQAIFRRLNGRKFLVRGNHDKVGARLPWDGPVVDVARTVVPDPETGALRGRQGLVGHGHAFRHEVRVSGELVVGTPALKGEGRAVRRQDAAA